ncbi:MAG: metal-dependent phosphohydrolase, partial [Firmicutes bacterium]|nr:metal-dependent phosphohydrolase [Bacillota bacterium]
HGISGANIVYTELRQMGMPLDEICDITMAIANHEEETGKPVSPITAALIIADKSDAHRTRVHRKNSSDIHDRVNLAILDSQVEINKEAQSISLLIDFDQNSCEIMDYFAIYLKRMTMCKDAAAHLGCEFHLFINNLELLGMAEQRRAAGQI